MSPRDPCLWCDEPPVRFFLYADFSPGAACCWELAGVCASHLANEYAHITTLRPIDDARLLWEGPIP